jgi:hypothetical protein
MPIYYVTTLESLNRIAHALGFSWRKLWNLPENEGLRRKRGDPNVLRAGDEVFYPEKEEKEESGASEQCHTFRLPDVPFNLRIKVLTPLHLPLSGAEWFLDIDGEESPVQRTGGDGLIEADVSPDVRSVALCVQGLRIPLRLSDLDPANTHRGIQQRLANLGHKPPPKRKFVSIAQMLRQRLPPAGAFRQFPAVFVFCRMGVKFHPKPRITFS